MVSKYAVKESYILHSQGEKGTTVSCAKPNICGTIHGKILMEKILVNLMYVSLGIHQDCPHQC